MISGWTSASACLVAGNPRTALFSEKTISSVSTTPKRSSPSPNSLSFSLPLSPSSLIVLLVSGNQYQGHTQGLKISRLKDLK